MKALYRIIGVSILGTLTACCDMQCERQQYADMLLERVEVFKEENGRLARKLSEVGLIETEHSPAYYQLTSDSTYEIWYGPGLGESKVYRSSTKKWAKEG